MNYRSIARRFSPVGGRYIKILTVALGLLAITNASPVSEYGFRPAGTEIVELRDEVSRHYSNGDGRITAMISVGPVNFKDEAGNWLLDEDAGRAYLPTFEYQYATGHCTYNGQAYGKTDFGHIKVEKEVDLAGGTETERVGWMKFNTSSLPPGVTITSAGIYRVFAYFEILRELYYRTVSVDPVTAGAQTLYRAIQNGQTCYEGTRGMLYDTTDMGPVGVSHIQSTLGQGWVTFGIAGKGYSRVLTKRLWIIGWNNNPQTMAPWLFVTYEPPAAVAEPGPMAETFEFTVGPSPLAGDFATLRYSLPQTGPATVSVFDATGRSVLSRDITTGQTGSVSLDLRELSAGIYLVKVDAEGFSGRQKLVVQR